MNNIKVSKKVNFLTKSVVLCFGYIIAGIIFKVKSTEKNKYLRAVKRYVNNPGSNESY